MTTRTDEELVALATAGDLDCFNQLVARWERPIYALAFRTLGREEEARDVVQEAFLRAWRFRDALPDGDGRRPWLYRVLVNTCYSQLRREVPWRQRAAGAAPEGKP